MLMFPDEAVDIAKMLNRWQIWSDRHVMGATDFEYVTVLLENVCQNLGFRNIRFFF